jgi:hypothetical protein
MFKARWFMAVVFFGMIAVGCSSEKTAKWNHKWQTIATIIEKDHFYIERKGKDSLSFVMFGSSSSKIKYNDTFALKTIVSKDCNGVGDNDRIIIHFDKRLIDPHLDFVDSTGKLLNSWCMKAVCLPKLREVAIGGNFVCLKNGQIVPDPE